MVEYVEEEAWIDQHLGLDWLEDHFPFGMTSFSRLFWFWGGGFRCLFRSVETSRQYAEDHMNLRINLFELSHNFTILWCNFLLIPVVKLCDSKTCSCSEKPRCLDFLGPHLGHAHPRVRYSAFQAMGQTAYDHDPYVAEILGPGEIGCWKGKSLVY